MGGIAIGCAGGVVCFLATGLVKQRWRIDDSLDVFAVHGIGGMLGALLVAPLALTALGGIGLAEGMTAASQLGIQALGILSVAAWSAIASIAIIKLLQALTGLRVDAEAESDGLDLSVHGERAYDHS